MESFGAESGVVVVLVVVVVAQKGRRGCNEGVVSCVQWPVNARRLLFQVTPVVCRRSLCEVGVPGGSLCGCGLAGGRPGRVRIAVR